MTYELPALPYPANALEPFIDEQTMIIHHDRHHKTYVDNLNAAMESIETLKTKSVQELISNLGEVPEHVRMQVRNNGGGHANHSLFWEVIGPQCGGEPTGDIEAALDQDIGGYGDFQREFKKAALTRFGSGWAWLVLGSNGKLAVSSTPNQDSPLMDGNIPLLGLDVWEHAYYLKYQNKRIDYIEAFWNIVNWPEVNKRLLEARNLLKN